MFGLGGSTMKRTVYFEDNVTRKDGKGIRGGGGGVGKIM